MHYLFYFAPQPWCRSRTARILIMLGAERPQLFCADGRLRSFAFVPADQQATGLLIIAMQELITSYVE